MGQGGPTWFFWVENAKIETGADRQAIALEGVTKLTIRHVWTDDNYTKSKKKQQKEQEVEAKRAKSTARRAVMAAQKKAAKDKTEERLGNGAVARAGKRKRAASEPTSKASAAGGKKGGFWAARKRGTAGESSGTAAPKFAGLGSPRTDQPAWTESDSESEEEDGGNVEHNDSEDDLEEDVDDLLENFDADEGDDGTSRLETAEVSDRIPNIVSRIASGRRRSRRDEGNVVESKYCRDEEISEADSDDLQADSVTSETGGQNLKQRFAAPEVDPASSEADSDSADESEDAEVGDDLAELAELTGYLEHFQKKTATEPPPLPPSERSDDANPAADAGNAEVAAAAAAAPVRSLNSKPRRTSDEGADGDGSKNRQLKSAISSSIGGIQGKGKGKGEQTSCSMVDDAGRDDCVGDDNDDDNDDDDRSGDRGYDARMAQVDAGFSGTVSAATVEVGIGAEGNERNSSNDNRNASRKMQGGSPVEEKEHSIRERRGNSSRGQQRKRTEVQRNGSTERIVAMNNDTELLEHRPIKNNQDSDSGGKTTSKSGGISRNENEISGAGENESGEKARGGGWGKRGTKAASMMSSLTPSTGIPSSPSSMEETRWCRPFPEVGRPHPYPVAKRNAVGMKTALLTTRQRPIPLERTSWTRFSKRKVKGLPRGESEEDDEDVAGDNQGSEREGDGRRATGGGCSSWSGGGISLENLELTSSDDDGDGNDDRDGDGVSEMITKSCVVSNKMRQAELSSQTKKSKDTSSDSDSEADSDPKESASGIQKQKKERLHENDGQFDSDLEEGLEGMIEGLENENGDAAGAEKAVKSADKSGGIKGKEAGSGASSDDEDGGESDDSNEETIRDFQHMLNCL